MTSILESEFSDLGLHGNFKYNNRYVSLLCVDHVGPGGEEALDFGQPLPPWKMLPLLIIRQWMKLQAV